MVKDFIKNTETAITDKPNLVRFGMSKRSMLKMMVDIKWKKLMRDFYQEGDFSAGKLLNTIRPFMDEFAEEPTEGWLRYIYDSITAELYPENYMSSDSEGRLKARLLFLLHYRNMLEYERTLREFSPVDDIALLTEEETEGCMTSAEYRRLREFWQDRFIYEFMRIGREITPFNTVGHVSGVHYVAMFIARQIERTDIPVDLSLVSGAAACHDIGKYGCSPKEAKRIPYLHYYYTDELLKRENMPMIAHIASNHSTWDLELENLSIESLLLIYSDFRVKSTRMEGVETVNFYTLDEAFDVILFKLDNVDEHKKLRYEKVYAKLKDFENYLVNMGIEVDIFKTPENAAGIPAQDDVLLMGSDVVEQIKYTAIEHNIRIMSIFNNEVAFGSMLEAARSETKWKSLRAYLNILLEYCTYMTKPEKLMTVHFLYDLFSHREGDIRRQAGRLMGIIFASYDDVYRKELPDFASGEIKGEGSELWHTYLHKIVFPDYRVTDQHRSWIGYTLKSVIGGLLDELDGEDFRPYMKWYFELFEMNRTDDSAVFTLLDSVTTLPDYVYGEEELVKVLKFAGDVSARKSVELKVGTLRVAEYMSRSFTCRRAREQIRIILNNGRCLLSGISALHLSYKILRNIGDTERAEKCYDKLIMMENMSDMGEDHISKIFRENLKMGTPWVIKAINIDFLLEYVTEEGLKDQYFHLAAHFSNLVKVSERVTVRHRAGRGLIEISRRLPADQLNEIVIELTKGLEIGEYQFSKYIPEYLGELALYLYPSEFDEFISSLWELIQNENDKIGSVALDTVGEIIKNYSGYRYRTEEKEEHYRSRKLRLLGMLLKGMSNYHEIVSQEAFMVIGQYIFGDKSLTVDEKYDIFRVIYKKMLTLISSISEYDMNFYTNAAALNHIYRFISEYKFDRGEMILPVNRNIAFFPGTFDPFSLSHKGIVKEIIKEGFDVYLAIDEFSWSKKTQPRMIRRKIITMSVADEPNVFLFPDDVPVNIANPGDIRRLKDIFSGCSLYIVVGSDVIENASSYKAKPLQHSIHSLNHIVFNRESDEEKLNEGHAVDYENIDADVMRLSLPTHLEDISSTRIRENIDSGRDISNLIDSVAQNYIYDNSLYLREPQYKNVLEANRIAFEPLNHVDSSIINDLQKDMKAYGVDPDEFRRYISRVNVKTAVIRDSSGRVCAMAAVNRLDTKDLYEEFNDVEIASYFREKATGQMLVIRGLYCAANVGIRNILQLLMTEVLTEAAAKDVTYAIYHPLDGRVNADVADILSRQGFCQVNIMEHPHDIYEVSMKDPIAVIENMDTVLKSPFNSNPYILDVLSATHADLQRALTKLNPGNLVLSFNAGVMHQRIVEMVTSLNGVPNKKLEKRQLGQCMCVPFGKILRGMAVPNTVTKTLHTEKVFSPKLDSFTIQEYPMYATIDNQIKTIKSFNRPVILVDDLMHKGYRMKALGPMFHDNDLDIIALVTGLLSGRGRDLMHQYGFNVESAYFLPNLKAWFVESTLCPFIGGDGVETEEKTEASLIPSINQILPFAMPTFLHDASRESIYNMSMVCLENAKKIFTVLEGEYQSLFERKLTIKSLSDVIISPRMPNGSNRVAADFNLSPSIYMEDYLERLVRLEHALK